MTITYIKGDATCPQAAGTKVIAHCCNDLGAWGKGFVLAISNRWEEPEAEYRAWSKLGKAGGFELGATQFVQCEPTIWVANIIGQRGIKTGSKGPPIRYDAIAQGFQSLAVKGVELSASIHMPRIGCGLAGGKWDEIEPLIESHLTQAGVAVTVYDF